jgi:eukaryotic-like serine/threonine-protein kinase
MGPKNGSEDAQTVTRVDGARDPASTESKASIRRDPFVVGEILSHRYRVEYIIGEGAMGIVVAATHLDLDELVAIKFIRPELQDLPNVVGRFAREAKAAVRIKSDHVAKVLDVAVVPGRGPCIVMEYLEGMTLAEVLMRSGSLPVRRAVEYVLQACEAIAFAHAQNITHRDLKPDNLFLTRRGDLEIVKVLDFGISKSALTGSVFGGPLALEDTTCQMGTPLYMSPEQIRGTGSVDHRTDIWSLGALLYELLTGTPPFVAPSIMQICAQVLESTPPPLRERCEGASAELEAIVDRCLHKDAAWRYDNVFDLALALASFAPSRCRLHVERCASVLRGAGLLLGAQHMPSSPAPSLGAVAVSLPAPPSLPQLISARPSTEPQRSLHPGESSKVQRSRRGQIAVLALGAVALLGGAVLFRTSVQAPRTSAPALALAPAAAAPIVGSSWPMVAARLDEPQLELDHGVMKQNPRISKPTRKLPGIPDPPASRQEDSTAPTETVTPVTSASASGDAQPRPSATPIADPPKPSSPTNRRKFRTTF